MMSRENIIAVLGILKTAYPRFYANMTKNEAEETIALWQEMFSDTDIQVLILAVKRLITHLEFPPTIADVKKEIVKVTSKDEKVPLDYWNEAFKMMNRASIMTIDEFKSSSKVCQSFFGNSLSNVRDYGSMEREDVLNNVQPRFIKFAENFVKEEKERKLLPTKFNDMVSQIANSMSVKQIEGGDTIDTLE